MNLPADGAVRAGPTRPARLLRMMLLEVGLPVLAYYGLHAAGVSDYRALLAATVV
ncbi:MAG: hypothetical protein JO287_10925, partial [Pseudonocardiales bacterium]|nr:hypothetical protein [Pseudonocardiales bacterium]